jgi:hypothetical protein
MKFFNELKKLCTPAFVYLALSVFTILLIALQNIGNTNKYCVGSFTCKVGSTFMVFLLKAVYILFWTFILNVLCQSGYTNISWFLVVLPFVLLFLLLLLLMLNKGAIIISK